MDLLNYKTKTNLMLPFKGIWIVGNGGRDASKNNSQRNLQKLKWMEK